MDRTPATPVNVEVRGSGLTAGRVVGTLKDGYWDRTEVVELGDGSRRVRKSAKGGAPPGPWGVAALRKEIAYLSTLPEQAEIDLFQELLAEALLERVHPGAAIEPAPPASEPLSAHVVSVVAHALRALAVDPDLESLIGAQSIRLNGAPVGRRVAQHSTAAANKLLQFARPRAV